MVVLWAYTNMYVPHTEPLKLKPIWAFRVFKFSTVRLICVQIGRTFLSRGQVKLAPTKLQLSRHCLAIGLRLYAVLADKT